jgi:hypothetical protein
MTEGLWEESKGNLSAVSFDEREQTCRTSRAGLLIGVCFAIIACIVIFKGSRLQTGIVKQTSKRTESFPLAVIDLYSSRATLNRLSGKKISWLTESLFRLNGTFEFRIIISRDVPGPFPLKHQHVNSSDEHILPTGLT